MDAPAQQSGNLLVVHIVGTGGPGRRSGPYEAVELSVQIGKELAFVVPGDVARFEASVPIERIDGPDGPRWRGKAVHGPTRERFLYLVWTGTPAGQPRAMFRRAKLKLDAIPADVLARARETGSLRVTLALTGLDGCPVCATPKRVIWSS